jgi:flavin reductase (DIM6/NTAB) family NADH-FMN oxidoreductase RutF/DNA-binding MarR family transcriptional regulator
MAPAAALDVGALRVATHVYTNASGPRALVIAELEELLRAAGHPVSPRAYVALQVLVATGGAAAPVVAAHLSLDRAPAERALDELARAGLATSPLPAPDDPWVATPPGRELAARVPGPADDGRFASALETLTAGDVRRLAEQLTTLLVQLHPDAPGLPAGGAESARLRLWLTCVRIWRIARAEQTRFMTERTDGVLDAGAYQALYRIDEVPSTVSDVAAFLRVDERLGLRFVERLQAAGLVAHEPDPVRPLVPTTRGVDLLEAVPPFDPHGGFSRAVAQLPDGGRELEDLLGRLARGFGTTTAMDLSGFDVLLDRIRARHEAGPRPAVGREDFRSTMAEFPTGVAVVTIGSGAMHRAVTVNSLTSVSLDPPLLLVCFDRRSTALERLRRSGRFAANLLTAEQQHLAVRFGRRETAESLHSLDEGTWTDVDGVPALAGALAAIVCDVVETFEAGSHTIVLAEPRRIVAHPARETAEALGFWRSRYLPVRSPVPKEEKR